ncbi:MAG: efflux RND transporter periplasmic adaptor subunit [Endozoicomonadaceae bacterium]|nr:efflux RND transporter periplasmic adaptor subunit [Endozoicomonadaceae bacterium]
MRKKTWYVMMLSIVFLLFGTVIAFNLFKSQLLKKIFQNLPIPPAAIETITVTPSTWQPVLHAIGTIHSIEGVMLKNDQSGIIQKIYFQSGNYVKKGDILLSLEDELEKSALNEEKSHFLALKNKWNRAKQLYHEQVISQEAFDTIEAQYHASESKMNGLQVKLDRKKMVTPFSGNIGLHTLSVGQYISIGEPLFRLDNVEKIRFKFTISQKNISQVSIGLPVDLLVDAYPETVFQGEIIAIDSSVSSAGMILVHAAILNPMAKLKTGMFAKVKIKLPVEKNQFVIPLQAVSFNLYGTSVYIIEDYFDVTKKITYSSVKNTMIKMNGFEGEVARVSQGLKSGDQLVTSGHMKLWPGIPIKIINQPSVEN